MSKTELFCEKNGKLNVKNTILTGFGFLAASIAWAIYDPYITKILNIPNGIIVSKQILPFILYFFLL